VALTHRVKIRPKYVRDKQKKYIRSAKIQNIKSFSLSPLPFAVWLWRIYFNKRIVSLADCGPIVYLSIFNRLPFSINWIHTVVKQTIDNKFFCKSESDPSNIIVDKNARHHESDVVKVFVECWLFQTKIDCRKF